MKKTDALMKNTGEMVTISRAEYEEFHLLLVNWREEIINSFTIVEGKRINNSYMESKNRLVSRLIYNANGFKNFRRTRNRILFCLNPNDSFKF